MVRTRKLKDGFVGEVSGETYFHTKNIAEIGIEEGSSSYLVYAKSFSCEKYVIEIFMFESDAKSNDIDPALIRASELIESLFEE